MTRFTRKTRRAATPVARRVARPLLCRPGEGHARVSFSCRAMLPVVPIPRRRPRQLRMTIDTVSKLLTALLDLQPLLLRLEARGLLDPDPASGPESHPTMTDPQPLPTSNSGFLALARSLVSLLDHEIQTRSSP